MFDVFTAAAHKERESNRTDTHHDADGGKWAVTRLGADVLKILHA